MSSGHDPFTPAQVVSCEFSTLPSYGISSFDRSYRFADRYNLSLGIENLLDGEKASCIGANPLNVPFALDCSRTGDGSTYDPLGRRFYVQMTMDF